MNTVLVVSPEPWHAHTVSKHHYSQALARNGKLVLFAGPPEAACKALSIEDIPGCPRVRLIRSPKVATGLRFMPNALRRILEARWLNRIEALAGTDIDTIWLFENSRFYDMRFAGDRLKIYHQVDLNQDLHPAIAAATADICFCTTDFILERLRPNNPRAFKIHHGLAENYSAPLLLDEQRILIDHPGSNAVYVGNLDMEYLDVELLKETVLQYPDVRFHFLGGYSEQGELRQIAGSFPNVVWWGKVHSTLLPEILERADILLVTYKNELYREQLASPHKFMEYLASGKTIVATYTDEYKDKRHLLEMVDNRADYLDAFGRVITQLEEYNSAARQAERKAFAEAHTYSRQLDKIFGLLRQHNLPIV